MSSQVRRADTTKGPPLRILSIDGGGVRGYSVLILLQELMHKTYGEIHGEAPAPHQLPKPCDHFDLIGGTGTGGLIAIMLGRLRMDIETCKSVYVKVTKHVFETDKTFAGIPYNSTLYKATKLEEAIKECVRGHTISEDEGNDSYTSFSSKAGSSLDLPQRSSSGASRPSSSSNGGRVSGYARAFGNPDAEFYDMRENRTKTAVTAVYKGTPPSGSSVLLRSYDSRKEPPPEVHCTIWEAGRATCATQLAFKPIKIGQSIFVDEGAGKYNPTPQLVDEAVLNEWPGREVGVIVSIGSGKRPAGPSAEQHDWWEGFMVGGFADARKRLIAKIEGCEDIHQYMLRERLSQRNISRENYFRLNVEVGVGEFGMNEWNRISDIQTNTQRHLTKPDVQNINYNAAARLARIHAAKQRWDRTGSEGAARIRPHSFEAQHDYDYDHEEQQGGYVPPTNPLAVELPAEPTDIPQLDSRPSQRQPMYPPRLQQYQQYASADDKFAVLEDAHHPPYSPTSSQPPFSPISQTSTNTAPSQPGRPSVDSYDYNRPDPADLPAPLHPRHRVPSGSGSSSGPPVPPKTPIQQTNGASYGLPVRPAKESPRAPLPYPDTDGPPPVVNIANKPNFRM